MRPGETPAKIRAKQVAQRYSIGLSTVWLYAKQNWKSITRHIR